MEAKVIALPDKAPLRNNLPVVLARSEFFFSKVPSLGFTEPW